MNGSQTSVWDPFWRGCTSTTTLIRIRIYPYSRRLNASIQSACNLHLEFYTKIKRHELTSCSSPLQSSPLSTTTPGPSWQSLSVHFDLTQTPRPSVQFWASIQGAQHDDIHDKRQTRVQTNSRPPHRKGCNTSLFQSGSSRASTCVIRACVRACVRVRAALQVSPPRSRT